VQGLYLAQLYGAMQFPCVMVTTDEGALQQLWQDKMLPLISDVAFYGKA
jgi:hypothetical protein